ncbi:MAG: S46 family peptidase [Flavobacteriaceae bacterium]|nr:S46 family peptidase [Flavobacteriaceae bacterium]
MRLIKILIYLLVFQSSAQQGGMWIPSLLQGMNEQEMNQLGSKLTAQDIYDVNNSSLKDAIAHFGGGCTSEVISPKGLLLTNHHCGYGEIQSHSTVENDYLQDGFWAKNLKEELPNEDLYVDFIVRIVEVTNSVLQGLTNTMTEQQKQALITKNSNAIEKAAPIEPWQNTKIKSFYKGNQYFLFVTERFEDVRLVGAPPSSIGKFGSDTDNWMFPRHTGDFSLFRIYADKNNRPAKYSKDNVPYRPKHFLPISLDGVAENDFTLVFGFPGRTNEYLPAVAIDQTVHTINPAAIGIRETSLAIVDKFMRSDQDIKIKYASKFASIANYWKKWIGENQGIEKSGAIAARKELEVRFTNLVKQKNLKAYSHLLPEFDRLYAEIKEVSLARTYWSEIGYRNNELLRACLFAYQLVNTYHSRGKEAFEKRLPSTLNRLDRIYKNYSAKVDMPVFEALVEKYISEVPSSYVPASYKNLNLSKTTKEVYASSAFTALEKMRALFEGSPKEIVDRISSDKGYLFAKDLHQMYYETINPAFQKTNLEIAGVQKTYMKALMELFPNERFFPDANSTLRVTYGQVKGYAPRDAVYYKAVSYLDGVMEKYKPGDYEFDVPQKLRDLYVAKDFGPYADINGKVPVCFLGTNHTTGGNSGSPAIDAHGNLIGLNFDRVWEGTMSDMNYDPEICRNIMVDARYILFIIDKYAGAKHLIDEMKLVHPKK